MKKRIVVIGGGLAGCLLCNELVERSEVTLLEIGRKDTIQYPKIGFDQKKLAEVPTICFGGGGTTNLWHNGLIPINKDDVLSKEFVGILSEAQFFIDKTASSLFFKNKSFSAEYKKLLAEVKSIVNKIGLFNEGIDCLIYPKKFKKLTVDSKVNDIYSVDKIQFVPNGNIIKSVSYFKGQKKQTIDADVFIISAGALGSPNILKNLLTTTGHSFNNLGTGFIDHPMGFVGKIKFKKGVSRLISQLSLLEKGDFVSRNAIRLKSECGKYTCCAFFRPALTMDNSLWIYKYKSLLGASSGANRLRNGFSPRIFHPDIIAEIFSHLFGLKMPGRIYNILFMAEQKRGNNRVYYEGDELRVDWSITPEELAIYRSILKKLSFALQNVSDELNIETNITEDWLWSAAHHSCTTPLGITDNDLIDKDLKLKFCDNVYVCDGSVIQEHSYANTGLTIGQLAFRLAKRVLDA